MIHARTAQIAPALRMKRVRKLKVGVARGSTQELQFQSCLAENKIDVKSVNSVAFTNAVDMTVGLEQGAVDAAVIWGATSVAGGFERHSD
jgi:ABC-type nitrate/sulfonate/bicarbonate transport system substrate-binding protein